MRIFRALQKITGRKAAGDNHRPSIPSTLVAGAAALALVLTGCTSKPSDDISMVVSLAIPDFGTTEGIKWWADEIEERSDGRVDVEIFYAESLITGPESVNALNSKRVDAAWFSDAYVPNEAPLFQISGIPYDTTDSYAHSRALYDMYYENDAFRDEINDLGIHVTYFVPYTNTVSLAREPIVNVDDLQGKRFRAAGMTASALEQFGAGSVFVNTSDIFESIERGIIDGAASYDYGIASASGLVDAAPYVMDKQWGMYAATTIGMSLEFYESLPDDIRDIVDDVSRELQEDRWGEILNQAEREACETLTENGAEFVVWDDEAAAEASNSLHDDFVEVYKDSAVSRGVEAETVDEFYDQFHERYESYLNVSPYENNLGGCE